MQPRTFNTHIYEYKIQHHQSNLRKQHIHLENDTHIRRKHTHASYPNTYNKTLHTYKNQQLKIKFKKKMKQSKESHLFF